MNTDQPVETTKSASRPDDDEISLAEIITKLRLRWRYFVVLGFVGFVLGIYVAKTSPFYYPAYMVVIPVTGTNSTPQNLGNAVAGMLGGNMDTSPEFSLFTEYMSSTVVANRLQEKYGLLLEMYESRWNPQTQTWNPPSPGPQARLELMIMKWFGYPDAPDPSIQDIANYIKGSLSVSKVADSPMHRIEFRHSDPDEALLWLKRVYEETENHMLQNRRQTLRRQIGFLEQEFSQTTQLDHRTFISASISKLMLEMTLLQNGLPFVANVVEPPTVPAMPSGPQVFKTIGATALLGFVIAFVLVFLVDLMPGIARSMRLRD